MPHSGPFRRVRVQRLLPLLLAPALAGCSGTPFGEQLSGSFSSPGGGPVQPTTPPTQSPAGPAQGSASGGAATAPAAGGAATAPQASQPTSRPPRAPVLSPAPYRITLRLVGADPAAPAEAVTEALRSAGVPFEVEMIERIPGAASTSSPAPAPEPSPVPSAATGAAPGASQPPAARPAPAPR